ncbi:hypothetical protein WJX82_003623 [Trebouxia sp. C0006]
MSFSNFPLIPEAMKGRSVDARMYPKHEEVLAYLNAFAEEYDLKRHISFNTSVVGMQPVSSTHSDGHQECGPRWSVTTLTSGQERTRVYDAVVMVGASFSGDEIARKIAEVAKEVYVTARTYTNPNRPEPRSIIHHLSWLKSLNPDGSASFVGGETLHADSIIYATGYKYTYPFLHQAGLLTTDNMHVTPLLKAIFLIPTAPTLAFVGLPWKSVRFPQFELQDCWSSQWL